MDRSGKHIVIFQPSGRRGSARDGETLLSVAQGLGEQLVALCGGRGACGKCQVRIESGLFQRDGLTSSPDHLTPVSTAEEEFIGEERRAAGHRLACMAHVHGDLVVFVPEESRSEEQQVRKAASARRAILRPAVRTHNVVVSAPTLEDPPGDFERLSEALEQVHGVRMTRASLSALTLLPDLVRQAERTSGGSDSAETCLSVSTRGSKRTAELVRVAPASAPAPLGVAIDLGTTTMAVYLCDLGTGELMATGSMMNPQVAFGEDVMSRIAFALREPDGLSRLRASVVEGLNTLIGRLTSSIGRSPADVLDATLVGNTAMHHFALGLPPVGLGLSPFSPVLRSAVICRAGELGFSLAPTSYVYVLPLVAGFVGADTMGVVISEEPFLRDERSLIIDIGTNGELVAGNRERLVCASCATGPAFEGAHISHGMRAARGAIERVVIAPDTGEPRVSVIGGERPRGICGSGVIDGIAQLYLTGIIDRTGRFRPQEEQDRVRLTDTGWEYVLVKSGETATGRDIVLTQKDVRAVQLGKAALFAGARLLMKRLGWDALERVVLAGAFGTYIDRASAAVIGLFPAVDPERVTAVGNAAGDGARLALLDERKRREAERWAKRLEYMELSVEPGFQEEFVGAMHFPESVRT